MKKFDLIWASILTAIIAFVTVPSTHEIFINFTSTHPYISGCIKFGILATMGELLAVRVTTKSWNNLPKGIPYRAIIWGLFGMLIVLIFEIYGTGIRVAQEKGYLIAGEGLIFALQVSIILNTTFGPVLMTTHKITDTFIDLKYKYPREKISISKIANTIDWDGFLSFVIFKTIPFFWIPIQTITFMLPAEYKVLFAASLSLVLGLILAGAKAQSQKKSIVTHITPN